MKTLLLSEKPVTKDHMMYDPIDMECKIGKER